MLSILCRLVFLLALGVAGAVPPAQAFEAPPFQGDVLDEVGLLSETGKATLLQRIREMRDNSGIWAAIYIAKSLQGDTIEGAAEATFREWKLGQAGVDNGLLVVIVPSERRMRIEVGYGLEGPLTDALSKQVIDEVYKPAFRDKRFTEGLMQGFDVMAQAVSGRAPAPQTLAETPVEPPPSVEEIAVDWSAFGRLMAIVLGLNLIPAPLFVLARRYGRFKGRLDAGEGGREVTSAFVIYPFFAVFFGLFFGGFGLAFDDDREVFYGLIFMNLLFVGVFSIPFILIARRYLSASAYRRWQAHKRLMRIRKRSEKARSIFGVWFNPSKVSASSGGTMPEPRSSSSSRSSWSSGSSSSSGGGRSGGGGASGSW